MLFLLLKNITQQIMLGITFFLLWFRWKSVFLARFFEVFEDKTALYCPVDESCELYFLVWLDFELEEFLRNVCDLSRKSFNHFFTFNKVIYGNSALPNMPDMAKHLQILKVLIKRNQESSELIDLKPHAMFSSLFPCWTSSQIERSQNRLPVASARIFQAIMCQESCHTLSCL